MNNVIPFGKTSSKSLSFSLGVYLDNTQFPFSITTIIKEVGKENVNIQGRLTLTQMDDLLNKLTNMRREYLNNGVKGTVH